MKALAFTVSFVLAFLLFAVQPMATKMVLPVLGGTPAVWNTAMVTFQLLLLAGYAYAHVVTTRLPARWQWRLHALLIAVSLLFLPLHVVLVSNDALLHQPIRHLAAAFLLQLGLPFFVLSATAPLLQAWVSRSNHALARTPYVLYSASNFGSMLGLIGYVALIEPSFTLSQQSVVWSALFIGGTLLLITLGWRLNPAQAVPAQSGEIMPRASRIALWILLAFLPSALSLGVTSYITTDIAAVPLLWVLPLALYLLSFIDAFRTRPILVPFAIRVAPVIGVLALLAYGFQLQRYTTIFVAQLVAFTLLAFALHGWLARLKPAPQHLTAFYFCLSIGGALGGILIAIVAPLVFTETLEYPISLLLASVTAFALGRGQRGGSWKAQWPSALRVSGAMLANTLVFYGVIGIAMGYFTAHAFAFDARVLMVAGSASLLVIALTHRRYAATFTAANVLGVVLLLSAGHAVSGSVIFKQRSFFGVWKVLDAKDDNARYMIHNTTLHSVQFLNQQGPLKPLSYYRALTAVFKALPALHQHPYALMGLGAGTVQCFAAANQRVDLFEIDPMVVGLAQDPTMFSYLSQCPGTHEVFLGDGRMMLSRRPDGHYSAIVIDAFSSDSIPAHLITHEALAIYRDKLVPHGVIVMHTTNRHIDLWPLIAAQAKSLGMQAYGKHFPPVSEPLIYESYWVVLARDGADIAPLLKQDQGWQRLVDTTNRRPWTDDYVNILPYLKMLRRSEE